MSARPGIALGTGWRLARTDPGACPDPSGHAGLEWRPAAVPGATIGAFPEIADPDGHDWWFATDLDEPAPGEGERLLLHLEGIATLAEVFVGEERVLSSESMFESHAVDLGARLGGPVTLSILCRALEPELRRRRKPRARWRTRVARDGNLRWFRTTLLGRAPGFAPGPATVGPWRPVRLERRTGPALEEVRLRTRLDGDDGVLSVRARLDPAGMSAADGVEVILEGASGAHRGSLTVTEEGWAEGELRVPSVARWWPHTHGTPETHAVAVVVGGERLEAGHAGFRELGVPADPVRDGLAIEVNGTPVFCRGAVWTPLDLREQAPDSRLEETLTAMRDAGMNMVRLAGTGVYESERFHELCDRLGLLVWQDFMYANFDYPFEDDAFRQVAEAEAAAVAGRLAAHPSTAVLCGNSEIEQQVAMLGLDPAQGRGGFFGETLPSIATAAGADAIYVPSAPCGGTLPFRPDRGVANYYGVGGYRRPLADARAAGVRFAAECLALANVPEPAVVEELAPEAPGGATAHDPRWKAGVPRDAGTGWDFDDVRDHYLSHLYGEDPAELRRTDHDRYLELSRAVSGEVMAATMGEWRRLASPCGGALILWLRDLAAGAGWGVLDHGGTPKVAYHHLRRALAPTAVWLTDEGLGGLAAHVANDGPEPLSATLRVALYASFEHVTREASVAVDVPPHGVAEYDVEEILGGFADVSWAYRFGPPAQDLVVASLERGDEPVSQARFFPAGPPSAVEAPERLGLRAGHSGSGEVVVVSDRFAWGVRVTVPGHVPDDDAFDLEPGRPRRIRLRAEADGEPVGGSVTALNMAGGVPIGAAG